jgi:hypothetical protein
MILARVFTYVTPADRITKKYTVNEGITNLFVDLWVTFLKAFFEKAGGGI